MNLVTLRDGCWRTAWCAWTLLRALSGDDAYERYCDGLRTTVSDDLPLSRAAFFEQQTQQKWNRYLQLGK